MAISSTDAFGELAAEFRRRHPDGESLHYLETHSRRWELLLDLVASFGPCRVLDVGAGYEAEAMRARMPGSTVDTLGWIDYRYMPRAHEQHVELDLNDVQFQERRPELERYDVIVLAEVIEHLYTAPAIVLRYLEAALAPHGALILQTPNAVALKKRLQLVRGRNPYEPIREERLYAGHFHEYTVEELEQAAAAAGLRVQACMLRNYFRTGSRKNAMFARAERWVPPRLRDGITMVLRRTNHSAVPGV